MIKFRGKDKLTGDWRYGWLVKEPNGTCWISQYYHRGEWREVDPDTVGMGIEIDGKDYFEGDICKDDLGSIFAIVWSDYHQFGCKILNGGALTNGLIFPLWQWTKEKRMFEIIGNKWDNKELEAKNE